MLDVELNTQLDRMCRLYPATKGTREQLAEELVRVYRFTNSARFREICDAVVDAHKSTRAPTLADFTTAEALVKRRSGGPAASVCPECGGNHVVYADLHYRSGDSILECDGVMPCPRCNAALQLPPSKIDMVAVRQQTEPMSNLDRAQAMTPDAARATLRASERIGFPDAKWSPEVLDVLIAKAAEMDPPAEPGESETASPFLPVVCPPLPEAGGDNVDMPF